METNTKAGGTGKLGSADERVGGPLTLPELVKKKEALLHRHTFCNYSAGTDVVC